MREWFMLPEQIVKASYIHTNQDKLPTKCLDYSSVYINLYYKLFSLIITAGSNMASHMANHSYTNMYRIMRFIIDAFLFQLQLMAGYHHNASSMNVSSIPQIVDSYAYAHTRTHTIIKTYL